MISYIKEYIDALDKDKLNSILIKNNISLNSDELNIIYNYVKNDWYDFIYEDPTPILNDIENNINKDSYDKLFSAYKKAKEKYSIYL